jgi:predicted nucleotidyltransferase
VAVKSSCAIWLYGSTARGDADAESDIDVLVVSNDRDHSHPLSSLDIDGAAERPRAVSPMHFTWHEIESMAEYGSLFLHHLRLEGRPINGEHDRLSEILSVLPAYQRARHELDAFQTVLSDVHQSLEDPHSPAYELAVIGTALRHAFILGCYVSDQPDFGRTSPFHRLCRLLGEPHATADELATLYRFRLYQHNRASAPFVPTTDDVRRWLARADRLLMMIRERVDAFDRILHPAA